MENSEEKIKNIEKMTIEQLKSELQKIGQSTTGNKSSLKKRLLDTFERNISMNIKEKDIEGVTQKLEYQEELLSATTNESLVADTSPKNQGEVITNQEKNLTEPESLVNEVITRSSPQNKEEVIQNSKEYKENIILVFKNFQKIINIYIARGTYREEEIDTVIKMYSNFVEVIEALENDKTMQITSEIFKNIQMLFENAISRGKILPHELVDQGNKHIEFINCVNKLFKNNST